MAEPARRRGRRARGTGAARALHARWLAPVLAAALIGLAVLPASSSAAGPCDQPVTNPIACENTPARGPAERLAGDRGRRPDDPGLRDVDERQRRPDDRLQDQDARERLPHRHPAARLLRRRRRAQDRVEHPADGDAAADPAGVPDRRLDRPDRLRQLGRLGVVDGPERPPSRASTSRISCATTPAATARSPSSSATTRATPTSSLQTSDATWEAYNAYGGNSLYTCTVACPPGNPQAYKGAYAVSYNRPFDGVPDDRRRCSRTSSTPSTR